MMRREEIISRFQWGMSVLTAYIQFNKVLNLQDANIHSEGFICDLINVLYGCNFVNINNQKMNNRGYDLIDEDKKYIIQVTSAKSPRALVMKLKTLNNEMSAYIKKEEELLRIKRNRKDDKKSYSSQMLEDEKMLERYLKSNADLRGYTLFFMILSNDASVHKNYFGNIHNAFRIPEEICFSVPDCIMDFESLVKKLNSCSEISDKNTEDVFEKLEKFMNLNRTIFIKRSDVKFENNVETVIKEYSDNFTAPLFRHTYVENTKVCLNNLFVEPRIEIDGQESDNVVSILDDFLWNDPECRILFIEGDAAIGKSSLISWLCYHYLKLDDIGKSVFMNKRLVCIRLRELEFDEKNINVEECIRKYLRVSSLEIFCRKMEGALVILEGADEISMIEGVLNSGIEDFVNKARKIFNKNKIIITTRTNFINLRYFERKNFRCKNMQLLHFDSDRRYEWVKKYEECGEEVPVKTKEYIEQIDEAEAAGVADTPLALYLLVACDMRDDLKGNAWALYNEIFKNAIINTEYNENFSSTLEHPVKKEEKIIYDIVCNVAAKMFQNSIEERYYITSREMDEIIEGYGFDRDLREEIKRCCVLCSYWKKGKNIGALEFYHNNIRDYFFSEFLYRKVEEWLDRGYSLYENDDFTEIMCKHLSYGRLRKTTWEQSLLFFYLRLQYEKANYGENSRFLEKSNRLNEIPYFYSRVLLDENIFWKYSYGEMHYLKLKNTMFNMFIFIYIWQILYLKEENDKFRFWPDKEQLSKINQMRLFVEWIELFSEKIVTGEGHVVSTGSFCDLSGLDLSLALIEGIDFSCSVMESTNFYMCKGENACFRNCSLKYAVFRDADLKKADFSYADLTEADFSGADLEGAVLEGAYLDFTILNGANIKECNFTNASLINMNLDKVSFYNTSLDGALFMETSLKSIKASKKNLTGTQFDSCNLYKADFSNRTLEGIHFKNCELSSAEFRGAAITDTAFIGSEGSNIKFGDAAIKDSDFTNVKFLR